VTVAARRARTPGLWRRRLRILGRIVAVFSIVVALLVAIAHLPPMRASMP
jgi:hypothetical protein